MKAFFKLLPINKNHSLKIINYKFLYSLFMKVSLHVDALSILKLFKWNIPSDLKVLFLVMELRIFKLGSLTPLFCACSYAFEHALQQSLLEFVAGYENNIGKQIWNSTHIQT